MKTSKNQEFLMCKKSKFFSKIIFAFLVVILLVTACSNDSSQEAQLNSDSENLGYMEDIDQDFENSETDSYDKDLNMDWI